MRLLVGLSLLVSMALFAFGYFVVGKFRVLKGRMLSFYSFY